MENVKGGNMESINLSFLHGNHDRQHYELRAAVLKALAHPSRLMIIDELSRGERTVQELTELVGHDISTVSKHLHLLKTSNMLEADKRGKQVYYRLRIPCIVNFFHCLEAVIAADRNSR